MTIKKQFTSLIIVIIAIPVICMLYMATMHYIRKSDRILIKGYKELRKMEAGRFSKNEWDNIYRICENLPPDVECALLADDNTVLFSSISEIKKENILMYDELCSLLYRTSKTYFYQFTSPPIGEQKVVLITRIARRAVPQRRPENTIRTLIIILISFVILCALLTSKIAKNVFDSIIHLENCTHQIANGNLNVELTTPKNKIKKNEITSLAESLEKMRLELADSQNRRNRFIMGISHDLRTPVAIIKGYTEAIIDDVISEKKEIKNTMELINTKAAQLENMINSLINFVKLNDNELRKDFQKESIGKLVKEFAKDSELTSAVFKRKFSSSIDIPENIMVPLDKQLVTRALENLVSNAIRYTKENDEISINAHYNDEKIIIEVSDTGIGIEQKDLSHIFDLFYRGTNSRREEGIGIGLSVVKSIIDSHDWKISVTSKKNEGTTFTITIPAAQETC